MMCGEMKCEGAFDEGNARVSCSESSTSTEKVASGVMWKIRATIALLLHANRYSVFFRIWLLQYQYLFIVM